VHAEAIVTHVPNILNIDRRCSFMKCYTEQTLL